MLITVKDYNALSKDELYQLLALRCQVFVVEQDCPYQDLDGKDEKAIHVLGYREGQLAAYTRIFYPGDYFEEAAIGRVVTDPAFRRKGLGKEIMEASIGWISSNLPGHHIRLSAQVYLQRFYNELGFREEGDTYLEDNIPHISMVKKQ